MPKQLPQYGWMITRPQWVAIRDDKNMKGGAVSKGAASVSLGDALEKFHKAAAKGVREGKKEAEELQKVVDKYKAAVAKKYPQILDPIQKKLTSKIKLYLEGCTDVLRYADAYGANRSAVIEEMTIVSREFQGWATTGGGQGTFKPSNAKAAAEALKAFSKSVVAGTFVTDKVPEADGANMDRLFKATDGGVWNKPTLDGIAKALPALPTNL